MPDDCRMYWLHAMTPLHVGIGFGAGYIDLPIMREKITGWPIVPGSAIKGVLADQHGASGDVRDKDVNVRAAFGITGEDNSQAGALVFADARVVCLPVQSFYGTFAWVTCPLALKRLSRDLRLVGKKLPDVPDPQEAAFTTEACLLAAGGQAILSDLNLAAVKHVTVEAWSEFLSSAVFDASWKADFKARFVVLSDDNFNFLSATACEVNARVRIDEKTKTVEKGALWYEESLPAETILAGLIWCDGIRQKQTQHRSLLDLFCKDARTLQIGGKASIGRGRTRCVFGVPA